MLDPCVIKFYHYFIIIPFVENKRQPAMASL